MPDVLGTCEVDDSAHPLGEHDMSYVGKRCSGWSALECNADAGHPCGAYDGEPCVSCAEHLRESKAEARAGWSGASPQERDPEKYERDLREAGR